MQARPAPTGSEPCAATETGVHAGGQDRLEDRQVVRGQVPQHVDVALHQAQVDAHRVEVLQVAELAAADQAARSSCDRLGVAVGVVEHQHPAVVGRRPRPAARPSARWAPAASRPARACRPRARPWPRVVRGGRGGDRHGLTAGSASTSSNEAATRTVEYSPSTARPGRRRGRRGTPAQPGGLLGVARQVGTPVAGADDGQPHSAGDQDSLQRHSSASRRRPRGVTR